jgi:enoyl-CoA hydratase/carnithine racemase
VSEHVLYDVADDGIGTITLNRPEKRNAMTFVMLAEFIETVRKAGSDDDARVIVVTGSGGSFCAGTDLSDLNTVPGETRGVRGEADEHDVWWPLAACPKPVIAAVDGPAVGMGAEFTSQCDVRIASTSARFAWNFVHRGLVPDTGAGTWLLPRIIGLPAALKLLYSGEFLSAEQALELGYVAQVVEPDELQTAAREVATSFLAGSPFSQKLIKELVYKGIERDLGSHMREHVQALQACFRSEDHKEGVASFLERRPARFTGR